MGSIDLEKYLRERAEGWRSLANLSNLDVPGDRFVNPEDIVITYGRRFGSNIALPNGFDRGEAKMCFGNTAEKLLDLMHLPHDPDWCYVEGFAASKTVGFPIMHAWLANRSGDVIDLTWDYQPGEAFYFGIPFSDQYVMSTVKRTGFYGLLVPGEMYNEELFAKKLGPEDFLHEWFQDEIMARTK